MTVFCFLHPGMGLGNQLWQIASSYGVASAIGASHCVLGIENFKGADFLEIRSDARTFFEVATVAAEPWYYDPRLCFSATLFNKNFLDLSRRTDVLLNGLLQDERYLNYPISDLFGFKPYFQDTLRSVQSSQVVWNVRGGEYRSHRQFMLTNNYWSGATRFLQATDATAPVCVTDDRQYASRLGTHTSIVSGDIGLCFATLMSASRMVTSNSTFSYFAIRLGEELGIIKKVIAPMYFNRPHNKIRLWASPSNVYKGYSYFSPSEGLRSYENSLCEARELESEYAAFPELYYPRRSVSSAIKSFFPSRLRQHIKNFLFERGVF